MILSTANVSANKGNTLVWPSKKFAFYFKQYNWLQF